MKPPKEIVAKQLFSLNTKPHILLEILKQRLLELRITIELPQQSDLIKNVKELELLAAKKRFILNNVQNKGNKLIESLLIKSKNWLIEETVGDSKLFWSQIVKLTEFIKTQWDLTTSNEQLEILLGCILVLRTLIALFELKLNIKLKIVNSKTLSCNSEFDFDVLK